MWHNVFMVIPKNVVELLKRFKTLWIPKPMFGCRVSLGVFIMALATLSTP
jgi:hypothetical protein